MRVVAIDGPSGAGKSTIARGIAGELGFDYLDTGALYRAVGLHLVGKGIPEDASDDELTAALESALVEFIQGKVLLNGADVSEEIRTPEAGHYASVFSAREPVRGFLMGTQRQAAEHADLVAEGRDMTTVVFPDAWVKIYLDASVEERARRRALELRAKGLPVDEEDVRRQIARRDERDSCRAIAPLRRAPDAVYIDSTGCGRRRLALFRRLGCQTLELPLEGPGAPVELQCLVQSDPNQPSLQR